MFATLCQRLLGAGGFVHYEVNHPFQPFTRFFLEEMWVTMAIGQSGSVQFDGFGQGNKDKIIKERESFEGLTAW